MKLKVEEAVKAAIDYLQKLRQSIGFDVKDIRLEEVEVSEDDRYWLITLSFTQPSDLTKNPLPGIVTQPKYQKEYKIFRINGNTGKVESMKIRVV
ncbi:MAG: hypothetical protein SAJ12_19350 [Jaaginema sp. PMC 1079.18]|nr:hypothetical protein [Jaaginema sp. PMC 1080.18]MEC4853144.1 hypothetical protein [Jaaginema sp. PMC 1079.18]MEC4868821.1 hypothetical protein [Jaaginema sp. PMC 1078.18]